MIRACIFDLGGTIVDKYSLSPFISFKQAFNQKKIMINNHLIYKDMGMEKKEHIKLILQNKKVSEKWNNLYNDYPSFKDVSELYQLFNQNQEINCKNIDILPETPKCINYLQMNTIKTGTTTGFSKENAFHIKNLLESNDIQLDSYVSSTCLSNHNGEFFTRPNPGMIFQNLVNMNIDNSSNVIKVDDTNVGIEEGKNAGCITVGVARWSTYMKVLPKDVSTITDEEVNERLKESRKFLNQSNPDYIIDTLDELPIIIRQINAKAEYY